MPAASSTICPPPARYAGPLLPPTRAGLRRWTVHITGWGQLTGRIVLPDPVTYDAPTGRRAERYVEGLMTAAAPGMEWEAIAL